MSQTALSGKVFAVYLFIAGTLVLTMPNLVLSIVHIPTTTEVWIRLMGLIAFAIGVYAWIAASHDFKPLMVASVYTRAMFFVVVTTFVLMGLAAPMTMLFGVVDLAGGIWTFFAMRADAAAASRKTA